MTVAKPGRYLHAPNGANYDTVRTLVRFHD